MNRIALAAVLCTGLCAHAEPTCSERAEQFSRWASDWIEHSIIHVAYGGPPVEGLLRISDKTANAKVPPDTTFAVERDRITLDGQVMLTNHPPISNGVEVRQQLLNRRRIVQLTRPDDPLPDSVNLAVAQDAPWSMVAWLLGQVWSAGYRHALFVFEDEVQPEQPPPSAITKALAQIDTESEPAKRQEVVARLVANLYRDCPNALNAFSESGQNRAPLGPQFAEGFRQCNCDVDFASLRTLHAAMFPRYDAHGASISLSNKPGSAVILPGSIPWKSAYAKILALAQKGQSLRVEAAGK